MNQSTSVVSESDQPQAKQSAATRWRKLLEDQQSSGLPISLFCRERGISQGSLFAWRRRLSAGDAKFAAVKVAGGKKAKPQRTNGQREDGSIKLCLPGHRRLILRSGFDRRLLLDLLAALEEKVSGPESRP